MQIFAKLKRMQQALLPPRMLRVRRGPVSAGKIPPLPAFPELTPLQKANLFHELTPEDLFDQINAPDIRSRVIQILDHLADNGLSDPEYRSCLGDKIWDERTAAHLVLTWYAWRFRPKSFLAAGPIDKTALAAVALTSPTTSILCLIDAGTFGARSNRRRLEQISRSVARNGYQSRVNLMRGTLSQISLMTNQAFDLILLNGSRGFKDGWPLAESFFRHCTLGGLIVCTRLCSSGLREREDFRVLEGPKGSGVILAFREKPGEREYQ